MKSQQQLANLLMQFINAETWLESKRIVEANPVLLTAEALAVLSQIMAENRDDEQATRVLQEHEQLLARCRTEGIDAAFTDRLPPASDALMSLLRTLQQPAQPSDMPRRIALCRQGLTWVSKETQPVIWAALQIALCDSLYQTPLGDKAENLEQAIVASQEALQVMTRQAMPSAWAAAMTLLATCYRHRIRGLRAENLEHAIAIAQQALEIRTRSAMPAFWAETMNGLGVTYFERIQGERTENLERAIAYYQQSLEIRTRQAMPRKWAQTMNNLGNAYYRRIQGPRAPNLEQAIACYEQALEVRTRQSMPIKWAQTMNNLGSAYCHRIRGHQAQNLEQAIVCCEQALEVRTRQAQPREWAQTINNLAMAYAARIRGEQAENLEQAIAFYKQALEVITRQATPLQWAGIMNNLAAAYTKRIRGERAENLEWAIAAFKQILSVRTRQIHPIEWAETITRLAIAYRERIRGKKAKNLEQAIAYHEQALKVQTREAMPTPWAATMHCLATAYSERIQGERADNLEWAIAYYEQSLEIRTRQAMQLEWARTTNNLANAYHHRIRGDRATNLEQAIAYHEQALPGLTRQATPVDWATTMNNLANAYSDRIQGDKAANLEQAIGYYQQALKVRTRQTIPLEWSQTTQNIATAYYKRILWERAANLEQAIVYYQQVLEVSTRQAMPVRWAETRHNLATAYSERIFGERAANLEQAIAYYKQVLDVRTRQAMPMKWAETMQNMALAYVSRIHGERAENLEQAIIYYEQALEISTRQAMPVLWAEIINNLALAYDDRIRGERAENLRRAIVCLKQALEIHTLGAIPNTHRLMQRNLAGLYFEECRWAEAQPAYAAALEASKLLYQAGATPEARQASLREAQALPARAAYCLAQLGRLTEAVQTLEQGKARALAEALTRHTAILAAASPADQADFMAARESLVLLETEARAIDQPWARDFLAVSTDLHHTRAKLADIVSRIRAYVPEFMPVGLDFAGLAAVAKTLDQPLVYLLTTTAGGLALIVPPDVTTLKRDHLVWLDQFKTDDLDTIFDGREGKQGYLHGTVLANTDTLKSALDEALPKLSSDLMAPVANRLRQLGHQQAHLIPSGTLSLLPLHAITSQEVIFTFAPSARALQTAESAIDGASLSPVLLGIGNPLPNPKPLPFARLEVEEISRLATAHTGIPARFTFYEKAATREAVVGNLAGATHLHFSCHGTFNVQQPLDSALYLAGDDTLTLRDLLSGGLDLSAARLAVLSACQSGITDFQNVPDEAIGFPAGFLQAGVPGVISTLWPVDDISTSLLLSRFYGYHLEEDFPPAAALWKAQQWLRNVTAGELRDYFAALRGKPDNERAMTYQQASAAWRAFARQKREQKPFAHPFYWAAFTFTGV